MRALIFVGNSIGDEINGGGCASVLLCGVGSGML